MGRKSVTVTVHGGISVVSAFPCGKGASVALEIPLATSIEPGGRPGEFEYIVKSISDRLGGDVNFSISVVSGIPERQGLKSSSALVGSILLAYAAYNNIELDDSEFLKIGSEVSLETSLSATGATDDLAASIFGGLCMTDNIHKNLESYGRVMSWLMENGAGRNSTLAYIGGGTVGDLAGFEVPVIYV